VAYKYCYVHRRALEPLGVRPGCLISGYIAMDSRMGDDSRTPEHALLSFNVHESPPPSRRSTQNGKQVKNMKQEQVQK